MRPGVALKQGDAEPIASGREPGIRLGLKRAVERPDNDRRSDYAKEGRHTR